MFMDVLFFGFSFLVLLITSGFTTDAAVRVTKIDDWKENPKLKAAHKNLTWAAIIGWLSVTLILISAVLFLFFGTEEAVPEAIEADKTGGPNFITIFIYGMLIISLIATIFVGILSAMASADINDSKVKDNKSSAKQSIIAAVLAILGALILIITLALKFFYKPKTKADTQNIEIKRLEGELTE